MQCTDNVAPFKTLHTAYIFTYYLKKNSKQYAVYTMQYAGIPFWTQPVQPV